MADIISSSSLQALAKFNKDLSNYAKCSEALVPPESFEVIVKNEIKTKVNSEKKRLLDIRTQKADNLDEKAFKTLEKKHSDDLEKFEKDMISKIITIDKSIFNKEEDPEFDGLISALTARKTIDARNRYVKNLFKKWGFELKSNSNLLMKVYLQELPNLKPVFGVRIFNAIFGQYKTEKGNNMSVTRYVSHMEGVLKNFHKGNSLEKVIELLVKAEVKNVALAGFIIQNYKNEETEWYKKHESKNEIIEALNMIKSHKSFYELLSKYDRSVINDTNIAKYSSKMKELDRIANEAVCTPGSSFDVFLKKYVDLLRALRTLDEKPQTKQGKDGKVIKVITYDKWFTKSIKKTLPFKLSQETLGKIEYCIVNSQDPIIVKREYLPISGKEKIAKEKKREMNEFIIEDFEMDIINIQDFDKFVCIDKEQMPKPERLAHGIRLAHYVIDRTRLIQIAQHGKTRFSVYLEC